MSQKELKRVKVISTLCDGNISNSEAAATLGICVRQIIRLKKKFSVLGDSAVIHGNRNRQPAHTIGMEVRSLVIRLFQEKYADFNFSHFTDMLNDVEGVKISRASVARVLLAAGFRSKKHVSRRQKLHRSRPRKAAAGMLWQTDATKFEWFGEGKGYATLHAYIDDATNIVVGAFFTVNECMNGYAQALRRGVEKYGLPMEIYSDRHTIFRSTKKLSDDEIAEGKQLPLSDFGEGLAELGIAQIFALSPEAKGRIERLWGTLQDRLTVEMRLKGITDIEAANRALPKLIARHNKRFAVAAKEKSVYVPLIEPVDFDLLFAHRNMRKTDHSGAVSYEGSIYAPCAGSASGVLAKRSVEVRETFDGRLYYGIDRKFIALEKIEKPVRKSTSRSTKQAAPSLTKVCKPAPDHPWRRYSSPRTKIDVISPHPAAS